MNLDSVEIAGLHLDEGPVLLKAVRTMQTYTSLEGSGKSLRLWGDFNPVSKTSTNWWVHTHGVFSQITQKGLSHSERDTCKTPSCDDHAAVAAAALEEALMGQVGIWETGVKSRPQWSFPPTTESDLIPLSRRAGFFFMPVSARYVTGFLHQSQSPSNNSLTSCILINKISLRVNLGVTAPRGAATRIAWQPTADHVHLYWLLQRLLRGKESRKNKERGEKLSRREHFLAHPA